ncbi:PaaI family thioesterase [Nocardia higoensis]|uniref:PaaI family thioesterase n=1 Tax=Nocardia higoensis TaxID=228599 RepID=UPI001E366D4B|nr:PaaI family thioesterase [Nocardia higoensis]
MTTGEPVAVPWSVIPDYHCFGCSPHNAAGLRLTFTPHPDGLRADFRLDRSFESYPGVVHGGLTGVICDELMGNLIVLTRHRPAFTVTQRTRFLTPLLIARDYHCVAALEPSPPGQPLRARAEIRAADGAVCATSTATYQPFALEDARRHLTLDDDEIAALAHALATGDHTAPDPTAPHPPAAHSPAAHSPATNPTATNGVPS